MSAALTSTIASTARRAGRCHVTAAAATTASSSSSPSPRCMSSSARASSSTSPHLTQPRPIPTAAEILGGLDAGSLVPPSRMKPVSAEYYTGRPKYIKFLIDLEDITRQTRRALETHHVILRDGRPPSPADVAGMTGVPTSSGRGGSGLTLTSRSSWLNKEDMSKLMGTTLKSSQYEAAVDGLSKLGLYAPLANFYLGSSETHSNVVDRLTEMLDEYRRPTSANALRRTFFTSKTGVDEEGRVWAKGGRKDAKALVYIAPVDATTLGGIQINNKDVADYFSQLKHREHVIHPLRLTHLLGQFNIFVLTGGGGHTGQSGATAHGIAKAIMRYYEEMEAQRITALESYEGQDFTGQVQTLIKAKDQATKITTQVRSVLSKDGVLRRDPRMVERKKTGLAKAKKAYTWVKR